jgi:hypothetical protein
MNSVRTEFLRPFVRNSFHPDHEIAISGIEAVLTGLRAEVIRKGIVPIDSNCY